MDTTPHPLAKLAALPAVEPDPAAGTAVEPDPFAGIAHEHALTAPEQRTAMLQRVRRTHVPLRKAFVQQPSTATTRPSVLGQMVNEKKLLPLRALLLIHALEPMLSDTYWTLDVWARIIAGTTTPQSKDRVSAAMRWLKNRHLISLEASGQKIGVFPRDEGGEDVDFVRASSAGAEVGPGYFTIPTEFWTSGMADELKMPGLAMFLVSLAETTQHPSFQVSLEQMAGWYGISERTAERGYAELRKQGILLEYTQHVNDLGSPTTRTHRVHRALAAPYSTASRATGQASVRDLLRNTTSSTPAAVPDQAATPAPASPSAPDFATPSPSAP